MTAAPKRRRRLATCFRVSCGVARSRGGRRLGLAREPGSAACSPLARQDGPPNTAVQHDYVRPGRPRRPARPTRCRPRRRLEVLASPGRNKPPAIALREEEQHIGGRQRRALARSIQRSTRRIVLGQSRGNPTPGDGRKPGPGWFQRPIRRACPGEQVRPVRPVRLWRKSPGGQPRSVWKNWRAS